MTSPLPVEITNHTDWWQPYVPPLVGLIGSIIVAAVAFVGVVKNNRTNQRAVDAADVRERDKWHRDNLLRVCSEAVRVGRDVGHHYNLAAATSVRLESPSDFENHFQEQIAAAEAAVNKIAPLATDMLLLGETSLYLMFQDIREVAETVTSPMIRYHRYLAANFDRIRPTESAGTEARAAMVAEVQASEQYQAYEKALAALSRANSTFSVAAQQKISPHALAALRPLAPTPHY